MLSADIGLCHRDAIVCNLHFPKVEMCKQCLQAQCRTRQFQQPGCMSSKSHWNTQLNFHTFDIHFATQLPTLYNSSRWASGGGGTRGTFAKLRSAHHLSSTSHLPKSIMFGKNSKHCSFHSRYPASAPWLRFLSTPRPAKYDSHAFTRSLLSQHSRPSLPKDIPIGLLLTRLRLMAALRTHLLASSAMHLRLGYPSDPPGRLLWAKFHLFSSTALVPRDRPT